MKPSWSFRPNMSFIAFFPPWKGHISLTVRDRAISAKIWASNPCTARMEWFWVLFQYPTLTLLCTPIPIGVHIEIVRFFFVLFFFFFFSWTFLCSTAQQKLLYASWWNFQRSCVTSWSESDTKKNDTFCPHVGAGGTKVDLGGLLDLSNYWTDFNK